MIRVGLGYDVHKLVSGRNLVLGGARIPHPKGLLGHSDADVLAHAVMDALLGALAMGDLGGHFPDSDPQFRDADSIALLKRVWRLIRVQGYACTNLDSVIIAEKPKLQPHLPNMRENLSLALETPLDRISVKATTTEKLGFTGKEEGIAAQAVVLLQKNG